MNTNAAPAPCICNDPAVSGSATPIAHARGADGCVYAYDPTQPDPHSHIEHVRTVAPGVIVCAEPGCGLVLERSGDALVVPFDVCECGHPRDEHQTGMGPYTGWCADLDCKCTDPTNPEDAGDDYYAAHDRGEHDGRESQFAERCFVCTYGPDEDRRVVR